jgi:hypothetical protein
MPDPIIDVTKYKPRVGNNVYQSGPDTYSVDKLDAYNTGYNPLMNSGSIENYRSQQQGPLNKAANAVPRFLLTTGTKTIGGLSDAVSSIHAAVNPNLNLAQALDNPFRRAIDAMEEDVKEQFKINHSDLYTEGNFWDKLGTADF